jgi:hypothetical protein
MKIQVAGEINEARFQVSEVASDEAAEPRSNEHALNHLNRVIAGIEQRDHPLAGSRGRLSLNHPRP